MRCMTGGHASAIVAAEDEREFFGSWNDGEHPADSRISFGMPLSGAPTISWKTRVAF